MWRYVILAGSIAVSAVQAPVLFEKVLDTRENRHQQQPAPQTGQVAMLSKGNVVQQNASKTALSGQKIKIKAGRDGHFYTEVRMNNRRVDVLVDTGATSVAINETTARKIGIYLKPADFKYKANTANGIAKMASAMIGEIRIGNIRVRNVRAGILKDSALSGTLLGMSFLKQLKRFEISGGTLLLEQ